MCLCVFFFTRRTLAVWLMQLSIWLPCFFTCLYDDDNVHFLRYVYVHIKITFILLVVSRLCVRVVHWNCTTFHASSEAKEIC